MSPPPFYRASPNLPMARTSFQKPVAISKAPIVNPYEKFTQPQFDAWIGDITGALRGALGYRAAAPPKPKARTQWHIPAPRSSEAPDATDEDADAELDDSFAEVKARRATTENGKGKGRDPREGPGLGKGERGAPIEIDLDSEEEEEEEEEEGQEWEDEDGMQTSDEEEEEENALRNGESSAHADARYRRYADRREDEAEDEYEDEGDAHDPDVIEVISDDEGGDERDMNGLPPQDDENSGDEYSDEADANPTSLLVASSKPTRIPERDYSDEGEEETGSESEDGAVTGSFPSRQAAGPHLHPDKPRYVLDDMFEEEDDELDDGGSPPRHERDEPEIIEVGSDDEDDHPDEEGDLQEDGEFAPEVERDEDGRPIQPQLRIQRNEPNIHEDDDVLPGSSPILSSPVEPEHSFPPANHDIFDVDELEDGGEVSAADQSKPFDWNHPPAFARGVPASGPGHIATPIEDDDIGDSDEYPQPGAFGTSDGLPTFKSQVQTDSEAEALQFDEETQEDVAEPIYPDLTEYFVTEVGEEQDLGNLGHLDAYTVSRSVSVDPQHFLVEEPYTDHEPDDRAMSIDVVTVDGEVEGQAEPDGGRVNQVLDDINGAKTQEGESGEDVPQEVQYSFPLGDVSEAAPELETTLDSDLNGEVDTQVKSLEAQIAIGHNRDASSFLPDMIPMPVLADPTVHDPSAPQPPTTPPHVPMALSLPGSPFMLSPVTTPAGQPTPVSLPVPASILKAMQKRQGSSLFTPSSEMPSASTTPNPSAQNDCESPVVSTANYFEEHDAKDTSINHSQSIPDFSTQMTAVNGENTEAAKGSLADEPTVDKLPADLNAGIEYTDMVQEEAPHEELDSVPEVELQELTPIQEIPAGVVSSEEIDDRHDEATGEETPPRDDGSATPRDKEPAAPEVEEVAEENHVGVAESDASTPVLDKEDLGGSSSPTISSTSHPTEPLAADVTDPDSNSLPLSMEHPEPMEQEAASEILVLSLSTNDNEQTDGEAISAINSQNNDAGDGDGDVDEMVLQYPSDSDIQAPAVLEVERVASVELECAASAEVDRGASVEVDVGTSVKFERTASVEMDNAVSDGAAYEISEESETDADGDDDPDYEDTSSASSVVGEIDIDQTVDETSDVDQGPAVEPASNEAVSTLAQDGMEDEPKLPEDLPGPSPETDVVLPKSVDESVEVDAPSNEAPDVLEEDNSSPVAKNEDPEVPLEVPSSSSADTAPVPETNGLTAHNSIDASVESEVKPVVVGDPQSSPPAESTALKRKRAHSITKEPLSTSSNSGKIAESRLSRLVNPKSNGKGKAKEEYVDYDDASSTSSASSAARMLNPGSRGTSRASSVASILSTKSSVVVVESSPRMNGIIRAARPPPKLPPPAPSLPPPQPPTLMHAHSHHRALPHHHHPPPLSRQPTQQRILQRTPSRSNIHEEAPTPSTSSIQMSAPPRRAPPAAGSPVTRSNCRYHRITLPEDDGSNTRVSFLVPGCSLGDKELMKEEEIQDMGNATEEDSLRMIKDINSLHFNSNLMSVLRQLVGVDLLREQEVYYLPPPGEEPLRKPRRREQSKLRISSGGSFASEGVMSPGVRSPASISSRPPTSAAGSSSTASGQARRHKRSDRESPASWAQSQGGDSTDDESPTAKRIRGADGEIREAEEEGIAAAASGSPLRTRRSRRMDKEAAEYKPDGPEGSEESSDEEENKGGRKKKKGKGRALKRARQSEAGPSQEGGEDRKTKKLKTHESIGDPVA